MTETAMRQGAADPPGERSARQQPGPDEQEINEELLEEAMRGAGTASSNAAINAALWEYVVNRRERRLAAFDRLQRRAEEEDLDFAAIEEADR